MPHTHRWRLLWSLQMGIADVEGWFPVVLCLTCPCGTTGVWAAEESTRLQQRRVHEGERHA